MDIDEDQAHIFLAHAKDLLKIWIETAQLDNEVVQMLKDELARVEEEREQLKHLNALQAAKLGEIVNVEAQLGFLRIQVDRGKRECEHLQLLNSLQASKQREKKRTRKRKGEQDWLKRSPNTHCTWFTGAAFSESLNSGMSSAAPQKGTSMLSSRKKSSRMLHMLLHRTHLLLQPQHLGL